ncbi:MAG: cytochrome b/b6 domain-containing protein [Candidatus Tectimicrobiota bacterium]
MTEMPREDRRAAPATDRWVKVWDLPTRLFHWLLVGLVVVGVVTGCVTPEWWLGVHIWAGYGLLALLAFRLVWGLCGPEYSRVVSFLYPPRRTVEHLRGLLLLRPPHYVGHNPTGALMVFALTGVVLAIVATGLLVLGGEEKQGPLMVVIGYAVGFAAKSVPSWLVLLLLALVACHVAGVVTESLLTHDNLVWAIITGWKRLPPEAPVPTPRPARPLLAAALFATLVGGAAGILQWLSRFPPPHSLRTLPPNSTHQQECGACHYALHPSLLPAASWAALMVSLGEHFGEDASLDGPTARQLAAWLVENAAETFDTESANRFRVVALEDPYRVTSTPYWVRKHASVPPEVFRRRSVQSKVNCQACHRDAASGRFDDQAIAMPEEHSP